MDRFLNCLNWVGRKLQGEYDYDRDYDSHRRSQVVKVQCQFCHKFAQLQPNAYGRANSTTDREFLHPRCEELRAKRADVLSYSDEELVEIQSLVHDEYVKIIQEKSDLEMEILRQQVAAEEQKLTQFMSGHKENVQRKRDYMYQQHEDRIRSIDADTTKTIGSLKQKAAKDRQQHKLLIKKNQDAHQRDVEKMEQELFGIRKKTEEMSSKYRQQVKEHDLQVQQCIEDRDRVFQKQETELAHKMSKETLDFKAELKKEQEEFKKQMEKERLALEEEFKAECQSELILTKEDGTVLEMREKTPGIVSRIAEQLMRD